MLSWHTLRAMLLGDIAPGLFLKSVWFRGSLRQYFLLWSRLSSGHPVCRVSTEQLIMDMGANTAPSLEMKGEVPACVQILFSAPPRPPALVALSGLLSETFPSW